MHPKGSRGESVLMEFSCEIRDLVASDWHDVRRIYLEGIASGQATFETEPPSWDDWNSNHLTSPRIIATVPGDDRVVGWAALAPVSRRAVYAGVAEVSVYVADEARGKGVGSKLLQQLINESERNGIWSLQASIFPENEASVRLHRSCGFREVGRRHRIAKLNGVWRDTVLFERRSTKHE
jgi:L-amino acid N-acyltransferase YncA